MSTLYFYKNIITPYFKYVNHGNSSYYLSTFSLKKIDCDDKILNFDWMKKCKSSFQTTSEFSVSLRILNDYLAKIYNKKFEILKEEQLFSLYYEKETFYLPDIITNVLDYSYILVKQDNGRYGLAKIGKNTYYITDLRESRNKFILLTYIDW